MSDGGYEIILGAAWALVIMALIFVISEDVIDRF